MERFVNPRPQFFDDSQVLAAGSALQFFESGLATDKDTFADSDGEILNVNPLPLNAGKIPNCFYEGAARVRLLDEFGAVIWDLDPVTPGGATGAFSDYNAVSTFDQNDIVVFENKFYLSKVNENQNNQPDTSPSEWEEIQFTRIYNSTTTYLLNDNVTDEGLEYRSLQGSNLNNTPASTPLFWELAGTNANNNRIINVSNATASGDAMNLAMATAASLYF